MIRPRARALTLEVRRAYTLRRLFFAFPSGVPGSALLLLRAVLAIAIVVETHDWAAVFGGLSGVFLALGLLTPIASLAAGLRILWVHGVFTNTWMIIVGESVCIALAGLGPGAFSIDARLFGRREIIIPGRNLSRH